MKENKDRGLELIKNNILFLSDSDTMEEAVEYFESIRHKDSPYKCQELFDELVKSQLAILFKILIDIGEVKINNNIISLKWTPNPKTQQEEKMKIDCEHRRIKKNYPFGHKSAPKMYCKDCGEVVTKYFLMLRKRRGRRWNPLNKK